MGWLQIILIIIKYGPAIYELLSELWDLIQHIRKERGEKAVNGAKTELHEALKRYRANRDRGPLRRLRDRLRNEAGFDN
jgi:hypothetical protein